MIQRKEKKEKEKQSLVEYKSAFKSITHSSVLVMRQANFFLFQLKIVIYYI